MIADKDLSPGNRLIYQDEHVMYVGRSQHGGLVIERDSRFLKGKPRFENVWPFQLRAIKENKNG